MKKLTYLFVVFALALFASCDTNESEIPIRNKMGVYEIAIVDSCEYVSVKRGYDFLWYITLIANFAEKGTSPREGKGIGRKAATISGITFGEQAEDWFL